MLFSRNDNPGNSNKNSSEVKTNMDEYNLQKINEYNRYKPEHALRDAELDINQGTIKIFYLDIEEVPEPLVIEGDPEKLLSHKRISIGTGCTDTVNSGDCPDEYRTAMENAISYGTDYNKAIASHFNLKPRICSSHLLRLVNPCCNACFTIFLLTISIDMPSSKNRSNYAFRYGLHRLATTPTAKSGLKHSGLDALLQ
jgi:hypothetical protein